MAGNPAKYGSVCKLYMDFRTEENTAAAGEYIVSNGGSVYEVLAATPSPSRPGRVNFTVRRTAPQDLPPDAQVWTLTWYKRRKARGKALPGAFR